MAKVKAAHAQPSVDTRERILGVAEELFADKGFPSTGIDEIAGKVGIAKSVIYYHFRNKQAILDAIIERFISDTIVLKKQYAGQWTGSGARGANDILGAGADRGVALAIEYLGSRARVLKIMVHETLHSRGSGSPLLRLWDDNVGVARAIVSRLAPRFSKQEVDRYFAEMYFIGFLPLVLFFVFADSWCDHYGVGRQQATRTFSRAWKSFVADYLVPRIARGARGVGSDRGGCDEP